MTRPERTENDARPGASGRASHQQETQDLRGSTLVSDTVAATPPRTSRIDPDTRGVQWTVVGLVGLLGLTSFAVSFRALHDVAAWAGIGPGLQWAVPVFIDGAILTYALAVLVHRSRGEAVWPSWTSLGVFTAMSVAANAAHAVAAPTSVWWQTVIGALLAGLAPLGVFAATEQMARLVVLRPQDRQAPVEPVEVPEGSLSAPVVSPGPARQVEQEAPAEVLAPAGHHRHVPVSHTLSSRCHRSHGRFRGENHVRHGPCYAGTLCESRRSLAVNTRLRLKWRE